MKKTLLTMAIAASFGLASASASAIGIYKEFTVSENGVPGAFQNTFVADYINGTYNELLQINADSTFQTNAYAIFDAFKKDDGTAAIPSPAPQLSASAGFSSNTYSMYALFSSSGIFTGTGFNGTSGSFDLYIDPSQDTTFGFTGINVVTNDVSGDDYKIAFSTNLLLAAGLIGNAQTSGSFDLYFDDFGLTAEGESYFTQPSPFHLLINVDGDFNQFTFSPGDTFQVNGDVSAVFPIPEPASLALLGLGLVGIGVSRRRKE